MARRPPKRYNPGELEAVKKRLGEISADEARRMQEVLGGEVGVEKSEYDRIKDKNYNLTTGRRRGRLDVIEEKYENTPPKFKKISNEERTEAETGLSKPKKEFSYLDRVKCDFLCRKPEYNIKSLASAIGSLFSFFLPIPDYVKPGFLLSAEKNIYQPVADLVKATRTLFTKTKEDIYTKIEQHKFYTKILKVIKSWDLESLEHEIIHLRKRLTTQNMRNMLRFCKMIYQPIMLLSKLDEGKHILSAFKWAYNVNTQATSSRVSEKERLISAYYDAEKNIPYVLYNLKKILYPFLLKRLASSFAHFDEFLIIERENILNFLGITEYDIIDPEEMDLDPVELEEAVTDGNEKNNEESGVDPLTKLPDNVVKGLNCLEKLFPKAGWFNLDEFPDLYPYFQPIFHFPTGFELIPPTDPLHQVIIFLSILNDLFYGFRDIWFGMLKDKKMEAYNIQGQIEGLINHWPLYIDEIISKTYISRLVDYCRQIEKDKGFKNSEVGRKITTEMNWIKKNYLLPYITFKMQTNVISIVKKQVPKLFALTNQILEPLSQVVQELKQKTEEEAKNKFESITNPWALYVFDLENPLSRRLNKILYTKVVDDAGNKKILDRRNNANLLYYSVSILTVLDFYLNNKDSHLYYSPSAKLFRSLHDGSDIPQYTVQTIDPDVFLDNMQSTMDEEINQVPEQTEKPPPSLQEAIEHKNIRNKKKGQIFSVLYLEYQATEGDEDKINLDLIKAQINADQDLIINAGENKLLLLLDNSDIKTTVELTRKLTIDLNREKTAAGIIQYQSTWQYHYFSRILDKTKEFTTRQGPGKLVYFDQTNNKFKSINI